MGRSPLVTAKDMSVTEVAGAEMFKCFILESNQYTLGGRRHWQDASHRKRKTSVILGSQRTVIKLGELLL